MSMFDLTQLNDDDLRALLFDALVERLDAKAQEDRSLALVNRMPTVVAVGRRGNLLTLSQGLGPWLLRGDLKCNDRRERLKTFTVGRATLQSRLTINPDRIEGTPDEILDRIVAMFLQWTAAEEKIRAGDEPVNGSRLTLPAAQETRSTSSPALQDTEPARRPARQESQTTAAVRPLPARRENAQQRQTPSCGSTQDRRSATPRTPRETRRPAAEIRQPISIVATDERSQALQIADQTISPEAVPPPPAPYHEKTPLALRTYQMLFETARRELDQAQATPASNRYFLLSAGVFVAFTAEAFFNDLGSRVIPSWSQLQRLDPREKAEVLSIELFNDKVDWSVRPFQSVAAALGFRRALAHAHAETLSFDEMQTTHRAASEVPRTRRTAWPEYCDPETIQRWIVDVRLVIEYFSRGHDPTEV
jgi:hypothetical protein